jgi:beta-N-acetylhexosaminidase
MIKLFGSSALWIVGLTFAFAAGNIDEPYLISLHGAGVAALLGICLVVLILLIARAWRKGASIARYALMLVWCLPPLLMGSAHLWFEARKHSVLHTDVVQARTLGRHFVVGYSSIAEVMPLAQKGLIAGIYIARHNIAGRTPEALKAEIAALQDSRRIAGLPPLIVAADQEGGIVSHLSPPLTALPALATLADLPRNIRAERAEEFGRIHGRELAALGINQDFAPVLDLRPKASHNRWDFNTLISQRAISGDPATVAELGLAYIRGLDAFNVRATVKHFPGLGRVRADTHYFSARLDTSLDELEASDWRPFREALTASKTQLMVGHVTLTAIDPDRPASHSQRVVKGIIRGKWNYQGVIITDDLVMGAIYHDNVCTAVVEALNAGVDLLLVAYDGSQFYRIFTCASDAFSQNKFDASVLSDSEMRLERTFSTD